MKSRCAQALLFLDHRESDALILHNLAEHGFVPLPKSVTESRIIANGRVDSFEIETKDIATMDALE